MRWLLPRFWRLRWYLGRRPSYRRSCRSMTEELCHNASYCRALYTAALTTQTTRHGAKHVQRTLNQMTMSGLEPLECSELSACDADELKLFHWKAPPVYGSYVCLTCLRTPQVSEDRKTTRPESYIQSLTLEREGWWPLPLLPPAISARLQQLQSFLGLVPLLQSSQRLLLYSSWFLSWNKLHPGACSEVPGLQSRRMVRREAGMCGKPNSWLTHWSRSCLSFRRTSTQLPPNFNGLIAGINACDNYMWRQTW